MLLAQRDQPHGHRLNPKEMSLDRSTWSGSMEAVLGVIRSEPRPSARAAGWWRTGADVAYAAPGVEVEAGARPALGPGLTRAISPLVADDLPDWSFGVGNVSALAPERTFWEKLLILHGLHCGRRDARRLPAGAGFQVVRGEGPCRGRWRADPARAHRA